MLRRYEVGKIVSRLSEIYVRDRRMFYEICGRLLIYCLAIGDERVAEMLRRELRRDLDRVPPKFLPLLRIDFDCRRLSLRDRILCLCSKMAIGRRLYFWDVFPVFYSVFKSGKIRDIVFLVKWFGLVMFKNYGVLSLDEILEGRGV